MRTRHIGLLLFATRKRRNKMTSSKANCKKHKNIVTSSGINALQPAAGPPAPVFPSRARQLAVRPPRKPGIAAANSFSYRCSSVFIGGPISSQSGKQAVSGPLHRPAQSNCKKHKNIVTSIRISALQPAAAARGPTSQAKTASRPGETWKTRHTRTPSSPESPWSPSCTSLFPPWPPDCTIPSAL